MRRLTMQEVIEHCEKTAKRFEDNVSFSREWLGMEPMPISAKQYLEHKQTAEWLKELQRYKDLEEVGRLIELPFKLGDKVWIIRHKKVFEATVIRVVLGISTSSIVENLDVVYECEDFFYNDGRMESILAMCRYLDDAFLTKAEAEAKLEEIQKGE